MKLRIFFGLITNLLGMLCFAWLMFNSTLCVYLLKMGQGQFSIIWNTKKISSMLAHDSLGPEQKEKLLLVDQVKKYSVDSLGYKPTRNFTTFYNQEGQPLLWVVTACKPFEFKPYFWNFPLIGSVSYKGFFSISLARQEYLRLLKMGYDIDISPVSAWSTLGWLSDPILSGMLKRNKGKLANLLFHELFHATYYAPGTVDVNENLANFISYKATLKFLAGDTAELNRFRYGVQDDSIYNKFILEKYDSLQNFYRRTRGMDSLKRLEAKQKKLIKIYQEAVKLRLHDTRRFQMANWSILEARNAFFIDARRYDGLYDSLNKVLEIRYKGDLRAMIDDLKK